MNEIREPFDLEVANAAAPAAEAEEPVHHDEAHTAFAGATRKVAWNSLIMSAGRLMGYASGLIMTALLTRMLTQVGYGAYTTAFTYLGIVFVVADAGMTLIGVREASRAPNALHDWLNTTLSLKLVFALVVYGIAIAAIFVLPYPPEARTATVVLAPALFSQTMAAGLDIAYQSRLRMQIPALADLSVKLVSLAGVFVLFVYQLRHPLPTTPLFYAAIGVIGCANLLAFFVRWIGLRRVLGAPLAFTTTRWRRLLVLALPMGIATILSQIHYKADVMLLTALRSLSDVAIYGVAYKVIDFMLIFFAVFGGMVYPVLARYSEESQERLTSSITRVLNMCITLAAPAAVGTMLLAPGILLIVGGARYQSATLVLRLLSVSAIFSFVSMIAQYVIIVQNRQRTLIWVACVNIIANVALNLYAIPRFSYVGSAVATDITEGLGMLLCLVVANQIYRVRPTWRIFAQTGAACLAMAAGLLVLQAWVLPETGILQTGVLVAAGSAVYILTLFAVGGVDPALLRTLTQRVPALGRLLTLRAE